MAEKRMFAKSIVLTDAFLDMPLSARCLYFTLGMLADDDGFVGSPKAVMRQCGATQDDMRILLAKRFVLGFDSGVIVIKHWRINNYLRSDRYTPTTYQEELELLTTDEKGSYTEASGERLPAGIPPGIPLVDTDKKSIDKNRIDKRREETAHARGEYGWVKLTDSQYEKLIQDLGQTEADRCIDVVDELAQQTGNKNKWKDWYLTVRKCHRDGWGFDKKKPARITNKTEPVPADYFKGLVAKI